MSDALEAGCGRLDIFFMTGLPQQTTQSVMATVDYCEHLLQKFNGNKRLSLFIAPISPFLDPGSLGFEKPERYGYRLLFRKLEEHDIERFLDNEALDGAGGYTNRMHPTLFERIEGSYTNVVGLPTEKLIPMLRDMGIRI